MQNELNITFNHFQDFLDLVKNQFGADAQATLEQLMKSGMTMQVGTSNITKRVKEKMIKQQRKIRNNFLPQQRAKVRNSDSGTKR
jgi:hypothetical protein